LGIAKSDLEGTVALSKMKMKKLNFTNEKLLNLIKSIGNAILICHDKKF